MFSIAAAVKAHTGKMLFFAAAFAILLAACSKKQPTGPAAGGTLASAFQRIYQRADSLSNKDPNLAIALADSALLLLQGQEVPGLRYKAYALKGNAMRSLNRYEEALKWLNQAYDLAVEEGNEEGKMNVSMNLGALYLLQKDQQKALELFTAARSALGPDSTDQLKRTKIMLCGSFGNVYKATNRFQEAIQEYHDGLALCKQYGFPEYEWLFYNNLSLIYAEMDDRPTELDYLMKASQSIAEDDARIGTVWNNIASALSNMDSLEASALWYKKALDCGHCLPLNRLKALNGSAETFLALEQYGMAQTRAAQALDMAVELNNLREQVRALDNLGRVDLATNRCPAGLARLEKARLLLQQSPNTAPSSDYVTLMEHYLEAALCAAGKPTLVGELKSYIELRDSVYDEEMVERVQALRVQHQTQQAKDSLEIMAQTNQIQALQLKRQQQRTLLQWLATALFAALAAGFYFFLAKRRRENEELAQLNTILKNDNAGLVEKMEALEKSVQQPASLHSFAEELVVLNGNEKTVFKIANILYIQAQGNGLQITTTEGKHWRWQRLRNLLDILPSPPFVQTHRSYIVNGMHIQSIQAGKFRMSNGEVVPIGGVHQDEVNRFLAKWLPNLA
jgi:DNA-binding LytR/AlgR family response regulator